MSIIFGPARQNGLVVANLDEAVQRWVDKLGAGPFFVVRHLPLDYFTYRGVRAAPTSAWPWATWATCRSS